MKTNWPALRHGYLILAGMTMATSPVLAQTQALAGATATSAVISSVAITQAPERSAVRVEGEGRLDVHAGRMRNPDRLVLDFAGARLAVQKTVIPGISAPVRGVRIGQYRPDVARVVVDLTTATPYQVSRDGEAVVIYFENPSATPVQPVSSVTTLTSQQNERTRPEFNYVAASPRVVTHHPSKNLRISAPRFPLPSELTQPSVSLASFSGKKEPVRPDSTTQQAAAQQAVQQAGAAATTMATSSQAQAPAAAPVGRYTGEPISVNLKDVDLKDFFRLIHEISGLNVVLDPAVKGTLTIVLDEVPWDQALDIVLRNNNMDKQLEGNVLRIATQDTIKKEAETKRDLLKAQAEAVEQVTSTRVLSYAKATAMRETLRRFLSPRGEILADERSNTLIIRDIPTVMPQVDNLIRQLDRKGQQVEIEARVVSATRSFARDIGTQFGFATTATRGRTLFGGLVGAPGFTSPISSGTGIPPPPLVTAGTTSLPFNTNLPAGAPTSGISFAHRSPNFAVDFIISAAEAKGVGKLLSKPKVITQNNEKAVVKQGTKVPVQTTINSTISVQFIDAVLKLEVTPQITAEGTISMIVLIENTAINAGIPRVQGIPALDTQSVEAHVVINDGGTVVIGGVIVSSQRTDISEVPLFGSIPLIGHLFKRTNVNVTSQELLFFLTPRIVPS